MQHFETSRFGTLEVNEDRIIDFPDGLLGFPDFRRYILMDYKDTPLKWLQSAEDPEIAFIVAAPQIFVADYSINIDPATQKHLQVEKESDLAVLVIIRIEGERVIANLQGPLVFNAGNMRGAQLVIDKFGGGKTKDRTARLSFL